MKKLLFILLCSGLFTSGFSRSTRGKEFWIGFMENINLATNGPPSFRIHISADVATTCTVSAPFTGYTSVISVAANQVFVFTLPAGNFNPFGDEAIANNGVRLLAADSVEVKAFHHRVYFTESTMILPVHEIGTEYIITTQPDLGNISPTEFVVVATQNNTAIEIVPHAVTVSTRPIGVAFTATLQQGQMYQVQAIGDLAGSSVRSLDPLKKIAVFGGARQARLGCNALADDHVYDQLYPVSSWGYNYQVVPFSGRLFDVIKVMAAQNSTSVSITNGNSYLLNQGQYATFTASTSCGITSDRPITVAQLATSQGCSGGLGDPGMIVLVPSNLLHYKTLFYTPATLALPTIDRFPLHRLNIVIKTSAIGNLTLDNVAIPSQSFSLVSPGSAYSYARLVLDTLGSLQHTLVCDSGFNAMIYSLPNYNFYGHHLGYGADVLNPMGVQSHGMGSSPAVFPVPTKGNLTVRASRPVSSIVITDLFGKEVLIMQGGGSAEVQLDIGSLSDGIYYGVVHYDGSDEAPEVIRLVKASKN
jgi:hypothetical protein